MDKEIEMSTDLVRAAPDQRRCALYRHFDDQDVLLYVGITDSLGDRTNGGHARTSDWVQFADRAEAEWHDSRELASVAERDAVREERPVFNRQYAEWDVDRSIADYVHARELRTLNSIIGLYQDAVGRFLGTVPDHILKEVEPRVVDSYLGYGLTDERARPAVVLEELSFAARARLGAARDAGSLVALQEVLGFVGKRVAELQDPWSVTEPPF
jgi:hypothetical protein